MTSPLCTRIANLYTVQYMVTRYNTNNKPMPDVRYFDCPLAAANYAYTMRNAKYPPTIDRIETPVA